MVVQEFIAQTVLDKVKSVTVSSRYPEVVLAFAAGGIEVSEDCSSVTGVAPDASFSSLADALKSSLPTAMISAKRVLAVNDIDL